MCNAWNHPPNCTCGWGGFGHLGIGGGGGGGFRGGVGTTFVFARPSNAAWHFRDSYAAPSTCPRCGGPVYFVRHNGGSVWLDELGWPWPKHACFVSEDEPAWTSYLRSNAPVPPRADLTSTQLEELSGTGDLLVGIVVSAARHHIDGVPLVVLGIDGGHLGRRVLAIDGDSTSTYYLGAIVVVTADACTLVTSKHSRKAIRKHELNPELLGFAPDWVSGAG